MNRPALRIRRCRAPPGRSVHRASAASGSHRTFAPARSLAARHPAHPRHGARRGGAEGWPSHRRACRSSRALPDSASCTCNTDSTASRGSLVRRTVHVCKRPAAPCCGTASDWARGAARVRSQLPTTVIHYQCAALTAGRWHPRHESEAARPSPGLAFHVRLGKRRLQTLRQSRCQLRVASEPPSRRILQSDELRETFPRLGLERTTRHGRVCARRART